MSKALGQGKRRRMTKFVIDEIAAVDFGAQETAKAVLMKRKGDPDYRRTKKADEDEDEDVPSFLKGRKLTLSDDAMTIYKSEDSRVAVLITSETDGHTHALHLWPGSLGGETSYGHDEGEEQSHDHPWSFDGMGGIVIGANAGHTHDVAPETVFAAVMAIQKGMTKRKLKRLQKDGLEIDADTFPIASEDQLVDAIQAFGGASDPDVTAEFIRESAVALSAEDLVPESGAMAFTDESETAEDLGKGRREMPKTELEKSQASVTSLEAKLARAEAINDLSADQSTYFKTLDETAGDAFLALDGDGKGAAVAKFAKAAADENPIVWTSKDGTEYRKADDPRIVKMAKERDEDRALLKSAQSEAQNATFIKRAAAELPHSPGDAEVGAAVLKALDSIEDEDLRGRAYLVVKAGDNALSGVFKRHGTTSVDPANDPLTFEKQGNASGKLDALVKARMEKDSMTEAEAYVEVLATPEGSELYDSATN